MFNFGNSSHKMWKELKSAEQTMSQSIFAIAFFFFFLCIRCCNKYACPAICILFNSCGAAMLFEWWEE